MAVDVFTSMDRHGRKQPSIWWDGYMKITYAMLAIGLLPAVVGILFF